MRMPQFGKENVGKLAEALAAAEGMIPDTAIHKVAATPMAGWGGRIADRHVRLVFSREPADRLRLLGERMLGALDDLGVPSSWRRG